MIPNPEPSFPVELLPNEVVAGFETAMTVAGAIAVMAAMILAGLLMHAYYAETYSGRGHALRGFVLALGLVIFFSLFVSMALNNWGYFIVALLAPFVAFGARWGVVSFLNRRGY
ncbi:hypothetical protein J7E45_17775 [Microbacterium sp. ISL-59]|uniref:hypothetical protein n=1 Tax=Microbacterium sp. ISL-59 TaxID=2819159 RepID=UPI001BE61892|nr:hypothetical protein [Microbacterium sp. ISL-59]MBT2497458.1 hypothetical protein [Microbacterium sp. ISL-59]